MKNKCEKIKKRLSSYEICKNPDGRKNKIRMSSSEFPMEVWLFKNKPEAKNFIKRTEAVLAIRKMRSLDKVKDKAELDSLRRYRKEMQW